ncbi:branched-chain amino acid ABC transporter ATP-binding protein/permease [Pseudonocardia acaciae]|uniref:branched-chain amino acid ABC transporter ATP-binding protein/permease n=1 Tax=Pseudonocardia acaciae TaxID=551276 RepID=UPI00048E0CA0|nr:branched-chain amino acid ABC transporter ATP-binding protein/permease [Pseudonocardia acaciae]
MTRRLAVAAAGLLLAVFPLVVSNQADQNIVILSLVLAAGAVAVNIMGGYAGYYSFGEAVPFGVGAYTVAVLAEHAGGSPFLWLPVAALASGGYALFVGAVAVRGRGHAFVVLTMVALLLVQFVATQWQDLTGGPAGLPLPTLGWDRDFQNWPFHYALLALLAGALLLSARLRRTRLGMGLLAIREDEDKAATIGIGTHAYKIVGFVLSAMLLGLDGGIYAYYAGFVDPVDTFSLVLSGQLLLAVLLGGAGTRYGPVLGAFLLELIDYYGNQTFGGGNARLFIVGGLMVVVVLFLPTGLLPSARAWLRARRARGTASAVGRRLADVEPGGGALVVRARRAEPDAREPLLRVEGLRRSFGGLRAVDGCSFEVPHGSITGLIGPNGSGKTTTFNLIGGTMRADAGHVWLSGECIDGLPPWTRAHRGLGRTFQLTRSFARLTVLENVVAPYSPHAVTSADRAEELLDFVGLHGFRDQPCGSLSYGQRKLVELAQVLMLDPTLVLLDEPAGGINPRLVERIAGLILALNQRGITFLIVEHNMPFILELSDRVLVLARGSCLASGTPAEIQRDPLVRDAYLGDELTGQGHPRP